MAEQTPQSTVENGAPKIEKQNEGIQVAQSTLLNLGENYEEAPARLTGETRKQGADFLSHHMESANARIASITATVPMNVKNTSLGA